MKRLNQGQSSCDAPLPVSQLHLFVVTEKVLSYAPLRQGSQVKVFVIQTYRRGMRAVRSTPSAL